MIPFQADRLTRYDALARKAHLATHQSEACTLDSAMELVRVLADMAIDSGSAEEARTIANRDPIEGVEPTND